MLSSYPGRAVLPGCLDLMDGVLGSYLRARMRGQLQKVQQYWIFRADASGERSCLPGAVNLRLPAGGVNKEVSESAMRVRRGGCGGGGVTAAAASVGR